MSTPSSSTSSTSTSSSSRTTAVSSPAHDRAGALSVLAAACLWGTSGTVRTAVPAASNTSIGAVRIVVGAAVLVAFATARRRRELVGLLSRARSWALLALAAAAMVTYQVAFFNAADRTGVAVGTVVTIASAPPFAGLLAVLTRQSRPTRRWFGATVGAATGCVLLVAGGGGGGGTGEAGVNLVGMALALLAGLAYACSTTVISSLLRRGEDDLAVTSALFGIAAVAVVPLLAVDWPAWAFAGQGATVALYLGCIATGGAYLLLGRGLRTTSAPVATTLTLAEPAVASTLGLVVLDEHLDPLAFAGLALLVTSIVALALPTRPRRAR